MTGEGLSVRYFSFYGTTPFTLITGGLLLNRSPLLSPPGPLERIKAYLTTNVAETRVDHEFPELRPRLVPASANETRDAVVAAMRTLH